MRKWCPLFINTSNLILGMAFEIIFLKPDNYLKHAKLKADNFLKHAVNFAWSQSLSIDNS